MFSFVYHVCNRSDHFHSITSWQFWTINKTAAVAPPLIIRVRMRLTLCPARLTFKLQTYKKSPSRIFGSRTRIAHSLTHRHRRRSTVDRIAVIVRSVNGARAGVLETFTRGGAQRRRRPRHRDTAESLHGFWGGGARSLALSTRWWGGRDDIISGWAANRHQSSSDWQPRRFVCSSFVRAVFLCASPQPVKCSCP